MGTPTIESFKAVLRSNIIQNCPVTVEDVTIAEKIYGPDISSLKGKSMRQKLKPVKKDTIEIPKESITKNHDINLCIDTMVVNECGMLNNQVQEPGTDEYQAEQGVLSSTRHYPASL